MSFGDFLRTNRLCVTLRGLAVVALFISVSSGLTPGRTTASSPADLVEITFYYDGNLNGTRNGNEQILVGLTVGSDSYHVVHRRGSVSVPRNSDVRLFVSGNSPLGKNLLNATFDEPGSPVPLEGGFRYQTGDEQIVMGLADGPLTSPIKPSQIGLKLYREMRRRSKIRRYLEDYYPDDWQDKYRFNYFFYGYRIPSGGLKGEPHLAFDIFANPRTPVHAGWGGEIVPGMYDWRFGIKSPFGTIYYNHIDPVVTIGQKVRRYDVVGHIDRSGKNHVHFELRPSPRRILDFFPGVLHGAMLTDPRRKEKVFRLPYFE